MTQIENYMHDGANWQAQAVLAFMRAANDNAINRTWDEERKCYDARVGVGRYENYREQGYIFSVAYDNEQRNYCVYEHRNSDQLCVVVFDAMTINTPTNDIVFKAMKGSKWNYTKAFEYGHIIECGCYIIDDIGKWIDKMIEKKKD